MKDVMLLDVTPLSLGTETTGGVMTVLVKRGSTIPIQSSMEFHTMEDNQTKMTIDVDSFFLASALKIQHSSINTHSINC